MNGENGRWAASTESGRDVPLGLQHFGYHWQPRSCRVLPSHSLQPQGSTVLRVLPQVFRVILKTPLVSALHQLFSRVRRGWRTQTPSPIAVPLPCVTEVLAGLARCPFSCSEASFKLGELGSWLSLRSQVPGFSLVLV